MKSKFYERNPEAEYIEWLITELVSNPKLIYYSVDRNEFECYDNFQLPIIITKLSSQDYFDDYDVNPKRW